VLEAEYADGLQRVGNMFKGTGGVDEEALYQLTSIDIPPQTKLVTGHLPLAALEFMPAPTRNFTLLRDPVERTISHYFFLADERDKGARGLRAKTSPAIRSGEDLRAALKSGLYFPDNLQTRMLADDPAARGPCTEQMLKEAKRNLSSKLQVFGLVERFDESLALFWRTFGWRSPLYRVRARTTANRPRAEDLSRAERKAIDVTITFDRELYDHAGKQFARQISTQDEQFELDVSAMQAAQRLIEHGKWATQGRPQQDDVFEYRVHQLCAEFEYLEERRRSRSLKLRANTAETELKQIRARAARLSARVQELRDEVARRPSPAPPPEEATEVREAARG